MNNIDPLTDRIIGVGDAYPLGAGGTISGLRNLTMNLGGQVALHVALPPAEVRAIRIDPEGTDACNPILPITCDPPGVFCFRDVFLPGRRIGGAVVIQVGRTGWVDPPVAFAYEYRMVGDARFLGIAEFPEGFAAPFSVIADGVPLPGVFGPGESVAFTPPGARSFAVVGITPRVDPTQPDAFPLAIWADQQVVSFDMTPLTTPSECETVMTATGCRSAAKNLLVLKKSGGSKDVLKWTWRNGASTTQAEFGDPTQTASYHFCAFTGSGAPLSGAIIPPSSTRWKVKGTKGFAYADKAGTEYGVKRMKLGASDVDRASIKLTGKGIGLSDPALPAMLPVTVRLVNTETGACWESVFEDAHVVKHTAALFKAKATR